MKIVPVRWLAPLLLLLPTAGVGMAAPVTGDRIEAAADEPQNWLTSAGDYGAHRYSGLSEINKANAGRMKLLFTVSLGPISAGEGFETARISAPLVDDGMLFTVDAFGTVYKIDVTSGVKGTILWTSKPLEAVMDPWLNGQWSLSFSGDSIVLAAGDGRLIWLNRETGALERTIAVDDPATGFALVAPPLLVDNTLIVGGAGGDRGARPQVAAFDSATGELAWRSYAVEEGAFVAGGSFLRTGIYDPQSELTLWSTSGPVPAFTAGLRQGKDHTNSLFAFDVGSGDIAWTRQLLADDTLGYNTAATPILNDGTALHFGDDGQFRRLTVANGNFDGQATIATGADGLSGETPPGCPNILAEDHMPSSLSSRSGLLYAAENNGCRADLGDIGNLAGDAEGGLYDNKTASTGALAAVDPQTGDVVAERFFDYPLQSGVLSLAGGMVFAATADGDVHLLDDTTLETVWSQQVSSLMATPPISYGVDGKQYIAFMVGGTPLYSELAYRGRNQVGVRHLTVLAVMGLEP